MTIGLNPGDCSAIVHSQCACKQTNTVCDTEARFLAVEEVHNVSSGIEGMGPSNNFPCAFRPHVRVKLSHLVTWPHSWDASCDLEDLPVDWRKVMATPVLV